MENNQNDEVEIDLLELFMVLRSRMTTIIATGVILAAIAGLITAFLIQPKYQSTSKLYILGGDTTLSSLTSLQVGSELAEDYIVLVKSRPVLEKVIENLGLDMEYEDIQEIITLNNPADTHILEITVTTDDPYIAKEIVDEVGSVATDRIESIMEVSPPSTLEPGHLESEPCSPSLKKNVLIAGIAGVLVSAFVIVVVYLLNDRIESEEDVEKYLGLNNLGVIPIEEGSVEQMMIDKRKRRRGRQSLFREISRKISRIGR